jgi:simple sugar transport system substrate-binding protein
MNVRLARWSLLVLTLLSLVLAACGSQPTTGSTPVPTAVSTEPTTPSAGEEFIFGMVLVGPINDGGWNQAHYEAAQYVVEKVPGVKFIYIDKVNPADRPNVKVEQAIEELIGQGARLIITNSAEFADGTNVAAAAHPEVAFIHASGDKVLTGEAPPNVRNLMGRMEYGKMIAGCAAALTTEAGRLAYLGPLIDPETRRLVNSSYLGDSHSSPSRQGGCYA